MSLDVYLKVKDPVARRSGIFVREDGRTKEITRAEWDAQNPGVEPHLVVDAEPTNTVYSDNITHNLSTMARSCGLYDALWQPGEIGITKAQQLVEPLQAGLQVLLADADKFRAHNPPNGWGTYDGLVEFVTNYLAACEEHPDADVRVHR